MKYTIGQLSHGAFAKMKLAIQRCGIPYDKSDEDLIAARLVGCANCPLAAPRPLTTRSECKGCNCPVFDKVRIRGELCPDDAKHPERAPAERRWPLPVIEG